MQFFKTFLLVVLITISSTSYALDTIIKKNNERIHAEITHITNTAIFYKTGDNIDDIVYTISKNEIHSITREDGSQLIIKDDKKDSFSLSLTNRLYTDNEAPQRLKYNEDFVYREGVKFNYGFGYSESGVNSATAIGLFVPIAFSNRNQGNVELEIGGTFIFSSGSTALGNFDTSLYGLSAALGYGFYFTEDLKTTAGVGYYYGTGTTTFAEFETEVDFNGVYYFSNIEYWLTNGFGLNVRYDVIMGFSVGILFKDFF